MESGLQRHLLTSSCGQADAARPHITAIQHCQAIALRIPSICERCRSVSAVARLFVLWTPSSRGRRPCSRWDGWALTPYRPSRERPVCGRCSRRGKPIVLGRLRRQRRCCRTRSCLLACERDDIQIAQQDVYSISQALPSITLLVCVVVVQVGSTDTPPGQHMVLATINQIE